LTKDQKIQLAELLQKHADAFGLDVEQLGMTHLVQHKILTGTNRPVAQKPIRIPQAHREEIRKQIEQMLHDKTIVPSTSPWSSPFFLVKKKDGSMRPVVDYRAVNAITQTDISDSQNG